jgi:hypothetical protein
MPQTGSWAKCWGQSYRVVHGVMVPTG